MLGRAPHPAGSAVDHSAIVRTWQAINRSEVTPTRDILRSLSPLPDTVTRAALRRLREEGLIHRTAGPNAGWVRKSASLAAVRSIARRHDKVTLRLSLLEAVRLAGPSGMPLEALCNAAECAGARWRLATPRQARYLINLLLDLGLLECQACPSGGRNAQLVCRCANLRLASNTLYAARAGTWPRRLPITE